MNYKVIIPSFRRSDTILKKTLKVLSETNIDLSNLYIFVADENEKRDYEKALDGFAVQYTIVVGERGIPNQRNFIQQYFPEGDRLFVIDDDISGIRVLNEAGKAEKLIDLDNFIKVAFTFTSNVGKKMWGVNANSNPLNMKNQVAIGLIYLVGNFYGLINTHDPHTFADTGEWIPSRKDFKSGKESHERALKHYVQFGGVVKFKNVGVESKYWGEPGGHQVSRTKDGEYEATQLINKRYPSLTKTRVFNDVWDITFVTGRTDNFPFNFYQHPNVPREKNNLKAV